MLSLRPLTQEIATALGTTKRFKERYQELFTTSQTQSIRDNQVAAQYIDDVIRRYQSIAATNPQQEKFQIKKNEYLFHLRQLVAEISVVSFSKPGDVITRLQQVDFKEDAIEKIVKGMEQAGDNDDDFCSIIGASSQTSVATCDALSDNNHHHHHHHHCH